jgi:C-terminal domain on Strawberry notch homologue
MISGWATQLLASQADPLIPTACRLLGLDPAAQKHVFDTFQAVLEATVEEARREGNYDEGIVDVAGSSVSLTSPPQTVRTVRHQPAP